MSRNCKIKIINKGQDHFIIKYFYKKRYFVFLILCVFIICPILGIAVVFTTPYPFLMLLFLSISEIIFLCYIAPGILSYEIILLNFNGIEIKRSLCGINYFSQKIKLEDFKKCYISTREPIYKWTPKIMSGQYKFFSWYFLRIVKIEIKKEINEKYPYEKITWRVVDSYLIDDAKWVMGEGEIKIISWGFKISEGDAQIVVNLINDFIQKHKKELSENQYVEPNQLIDS
ncbi:MAG: hypothetical protein LBT51_03100 [Fusobacteriaceae bacterium]|nr:hypothetical protein [Fusobacteriaceae bacterium]